jgi:hypothetical protein
VTLTSFLILILTLSIATFMNGELQRTTDYVDNIKAYYNAQSAAEEAVLAIKSQMSNPANAGQSLASIINQGCGQDTFAATYGQTIPGIVCRQVQANTAEAVDTLDDNQIIQYDLTNAPTQENLNISQVSLQWDMKYPPPGNGVFPSPSASALTQPGGSWGANTPPVIEMTVLNYFPGQQTNVDQTTNNCANGSGLATCSSGTVFLLPQWQTCNGNPCPSQVDFQAAAKNSTPGQNGSQPVIYSGCTYAPAGGSYRCSMNFNDISPPGYKTVLRFQSVFGDAQYDLKAYDSSGQQVQLPLQNAQIDVTANVGEAFNRVQIEVPIRSSAYPGFDTLYGDASLCKDFDVLTDPLTGVVSARQDPDGGCPL